MRLSRRAMLSGAAGAAVAAVAASLGAPLARAQDDGGAVPSLEKWLAELEDRSGIIPRSIAFVSDLPAKGKGQPKFLELDARALMEATYLRVADPATMAWDVKLNHDTASETDAAVAAQQMTRADTLVLAPAKGQWQFLRIGKNGKRETLKKAKAPKSTKAADIASWLPTALNWDGIVLDQKGDYVLVGSTAKLLAMPQIQALAIARSAGKLSISAAERKGAGLLSLMQSNGGVGIFEIVFLGQGISKLPVGTKLIIEKKKA